MPNHIQKSLIIGLLALGCSEGRDVTDVEVVEPVAPPGGQSPGGSPPGGQSPGGPPSCEAAPAGPLAALKLTLIVEELRNPTFVSAIPGDDEHLLVLEQSGLVRVVAGGEVLDEPFLDIYDRVNRSGGERGLLGLAMHPDYAENGRFFVHYSTLRVDGEDFEPGSGVISEFRRSSEDALRADADSERRLLVVDQPFRNHNGGMLAFGTRDGFLYAGFGDGGSGGDPQDNAQNPTSLLGKMLRLDVSSPSGEPGGAPYAIPADNPGFARPEIWSLGLRNPWRFSFDACTDDLYIADVGQNSLEEVDFEPPGSPGRNYGWNLLEGNACFPRSDDCELGARTPPILDYPRDFGGSITGGYVYRGQAIASLRGTYLYADYSSGRFGSLRVVGGQAVDVAELTADLNPDGLERITSFGQDNAGELYVALRTGEVFRIDAE